MEETGVPGENHWPVASHWQTLSYRVEHCLSGIQTHNVSFDKDEIYVYLFITTCIENVMNADK